MKTQEKEKIKIDRDEKAYIHKTAEYWDEHSFDDVWDTTKRVDANINITRSQCLVSVERELADELAQLAERRGVSPVTLLNTLLASALAHTK